MVFESVLSLEFLCTPVLLASSEVSTSLPGTTCSKVVDQDNNMLFNQRH